MASLESVEVRGRTDALDALGNTTAATGKGFAIGSAVLTSRASAATAVQAENPDFQLIGSHAEDERVMDGFCVLPEHGLLFCSGCQISRRLRSFGRGPSPSCKPSSSAWTRPGK